MKPKSVTCNDSPQSGDNYKLQISAWANCKISKTFAAIIAVLTMMIMHVQADNVTLTNVSGFKLFAGGGGYNGIYTNVQIRATLSGVFTNNPVTLSISGVPAGVTYGFLPNGLTNSQNPIFVTFAVTNVTKGVYPLTISAMTNGVAIGNSMVIPLIVGTVWTNNNPAGDVTWGSAINWSGGVPTSGDNVMFQDAGYNTNYLGSSVDIGSLTFIRNI
ncbi:MAG: hypothetical protein WCS42_08565, partial [Verrucomicrobiota bacterium]